MNWVLETILNRGSSDALTWQKGNEVRRRCLGVITCHGKQCSMHLAPGLRAMDRQKQLHHTCPVCEETLGLHRCGIESSLFRFRDGGVFIHGGAHTHQQFTHSSIFRRNGSLEFIEYVPKYRPRSRSPVPGFDLEPAAQSLSPVESVFDIAEHDNARTNSPGIQQGSDEVPDGNWEYADKDNN
ncbi:hypothetical protein B0H16DRAFT_1607380, partial [Mycena metata]